MPQSRLSFRLSATSLFAMATLLSVALSSVATAQTTETAAPTSGPSVFDGDYLTVGIGGGIGPSYEGSDDYIAIPFGALQGEIGGIAINPRVNGLALDVIPDADDARIGFAIGPVARVRFDRNSRIKDVAVAALGKRDIAIEVGATAGITGYRLLNDYDALTASVDVLFDVAGAHRGRVIAPMLSYLTPLSQGAAVVLSVSAEHVDDDYADYYYSVTAPQAIASGLPAFQAESGWKTASLNLLGTYDLDGDLTNGGFALFAAGSYSRMLEDAKRSPVTSIAGSANQWIGAIGIGYTF